MTRKSRDSLIQGPEGGQSKKTLQHKKTWFGIIQGLSRSREKVLPEKKSEEKKKLQKGTYGEGLREEGLGNSFKHDQVNLATREGLGRHPRERRPEEGSRTLRSRGQSEGWKI